MTLFKAKHFLVPWKCQLSSLFISVLSSDAELNPFQVRLLAMLNEYNHLRQEKEEEKRRMRVRTTKFVCISQMCLRFRAAYCQSRWQI